MITHADRQTLAVGFWSAVLATFLSLFYVVAQVAEWLGWLGSAGGPEASSTPLGIWVLLTPSLLLGPAFLLLLVSIHRVAPESKKVWSQAALAFGTIYAAFVVMNYFVQLAWVAPRLVEGRVSGMEAFLFVPFDSFLYAVDILGYSFMSLATLFVAQVFPRSGVEGVARRFLLANGAILIFLVGQMYVHGLIWLAAAWAVTFPGATWTLAVLFRRAGAEVEAETLTSDPRTRSGPRVPPRPPGIAGVAG